MTEVEQLYIKLQNAFGGNRSWNDLNGHEQTNFVQAVNIIMQICQSRKNTES